jgi:hypothetical protein
MHTGPKALGNEAAWESRPKLQPSIITGVDEAGLEGVGWIIGRFARFRSNHQSVRVFLRSL